MNKSTYTLIAALFASHLAFGEAQPASYGVEYGATFNYKASFKTSPYSTRASDPGAASGYADRTYDDGYNRQSSLTELTGATSYYRYESADQYDAANETLSFNSTLHNFEGGKQTGTQTEAQSAIRAYWQKELSNNETFNYGIRVAFGYQKIELDSVQTFGVNTEITTDVYELASGTVLLPAGQDGSYLPGGTSLIPNEPISRTLSAGTPYQYRQSFDFDVDMYNVDFGPIFTWQVAERVALEAFIGASVAFVDSELSYDDGYSNYGTDSDSDVLFGVVARGDLKVKLTDRWGLSFGLSCTQLEDFNQRASTHDASLEFGQSYSIHSGIFFE